LGLYTSRRAPQTFGAPDAGAQTFELHDLTVIDGPRISVNPRGRGLLSRSFTRRKGKLRSDLLSFDFIYPIYERITMRDRPSE
jgi:hypothetical protein